MKPKSRGFTTTSEERRENLLSFRSSAGGANAPRAFTLIEIIVVVALLGLIASAILASLTDAQREARDKRRIADLKSIEQALQLYYSENNAYPTESSGANGNMSTNAVFKTLMQKHIAGTPIDPTGIGNATYYYYYDGNHNCGGQAQVVIFARQMDKANNSNYDEFLNTTCSGVVDGEGRGGGVQSYNLIVGSSSD